VESELVEALRKDTVAIVKQVSIPILKSNCLTQLLQRPSRTWMGGDVAMDQARAAVLNHTTNALGVQAGRSTSAGHLAADAANIAASTC
jgi:hypothetical protein